GLPRRPRSRRRFGLLQGPRACTTSVAPGVDALRMPLVFEHAVAAAPYVLEVDVVRVLRRHLNAPSGERRGTLRRPSFELFAVWAPSYTADHEVGQVAEFVCYHVQEAVLTIDDLLRDVDGCMVPVLDVRLVCGRPADCLSLPVG